MTRSIWLALVIVFLAAGCGVQPPLQVGTVSLPDATVKQSYAAQLIALGQNLQLVWSLASGQLPPGVTLSSTTGVVSGQPSAQGEFAFSVRVTTVGTTPTISALSRNLKIRVRAKSATTPTPLAISTLSLPNGTQSAAYSASMNATGGTPPYSWGVASGSLPPGISLNASNGEVAGTASSTGTFSFTIVVQDSSSTAQRAIQALSIDIVSATSSLRINTSSLPSGTVANSYAGALAASGGKTPYSWGVASGALPPGIALSSSTGALAGTPTTAGTFPFTIGVQDASGQRATQSLSVAVVESKPSLQISTSSLPSGAVQVAYSAALAATGGTTPYAWSVIGGTFPSGLTLSAGTGAIAGTPTQAGSFSFTAQVKDSTGQTATATLSANIAPPSSPVVSGVSPKSGPTSGGTVVTISGSNFTSGATVAFGGTAASSVQVVNANQIQAVTPAEIAGTISVSVRENGQTATLSGGFTYNATTPTVTSISPNSGSTGGGTTVTISGSNFLAGALVLFGTVSAPSVNIASGSQIQVVTPAHASGLVDVAVVNPGNLSATLASAFTYNSTSSGPPTITSVSPTSGTPGAQITITGTNFVSADTVSFGSSPASSTFVSSTQLTVTVPNVSAGSYTITVTDPDPATVTFSGFTVTAASPSQSLLSGCTVTGASPSCATPSGWTLVRAEGFDSGTLGTGEWGRGGSITSAKGHTGNSSWTRLITGDGSDDSWGLTSSQVGSFNDIYMSSWTYVDPTAHIEAGNFYFFRLAIYLNGGNSFNGEVDVNLDNNDWANNANVVSITNPTVDVVTQAGSQQNFPTVDHEGDASYTWNLNLGTWQQNEWWFHDNTCTGSTANNDGFYRLFINGKLVLSQNNVNLTGCEQTSAGGWQAEVGGVDTVGIVENASGQCVGGEGTAIPSGGKQITVNPFSSAPALEADGVTPCMNQNNFNYYADDIIILKK